MDLKWDYVVHGVHMWHFFLQKVLVLYFSTNWGMITFQFLSCELLKTWLHYYHQTVLEVSLELEWTKDLESTSTYWRTMKDGWYVDRKHFFIVFLSHSLTMVISYVLTIPHVHGDLGATKSPLRNYPLIMILSTFGSLLEAFGLVGLQS